MEFLNDIPGMLHRAAHNKHSAGKTKVKHHKPRQTTTTTTTSSIAQTQPPQDDLITTTTRSFAAKTRNKRSSGPSTKRTVRKLIKNSPGHSSNNYMQGNANATKKFVTIQGDAPHTGDNDYHEDHIIQHGGDPNQPRIFSLDINRQQALQRQQALHQKDPLAHLKRHNVNPSQSIQDPVIMNQGIPLQLTPDSNEGKPYFKYGLFRRIALPPTPTDIHQTIKKRVEQVQAAKGFNNPKDRIKDHVLRRLHIGVQLFLQRIDAATNTLPASLTLLHPFEFEIASLTLSAHSHDVPLHTSNSTAVKPLSAVDADLLRKAVLYHEKIIDNQVITSNAPRYSTEIVDGFTPLREEGALYYNTVLYNVNKCREHIVHHYHKYKKLINECDLPQEFHDVSKKEVEDIEKMITSPQFVQTFDLFRKMLTTLKTQHWIDPNVPTMLCVGAPNVGKSSIVRAISTSKTPVQMYRFTTRRLTIGHMDVDGFTCQVTDSPGLLPRPDDQRNAMEALTLAAIKHLPLCSIIYVLDPSVQGGVSLQHQLLLRSELRWRYGQIIKDKWIDVATKADVWKNTYGVRKNTSPLTEPETYADDAITLMLQQEYHDKYNHDDINDMSNPKKRAAELKKRDKALSITPRWNLPEALADLGEIPPGFKDMTLPYFPISTIHLRDVHNEQQNIGLQGRFLRNKRQKLKIEAGKKRVKELEKQKAAVGTETFTGTSSLSLMDIGEDEGKKGDEEHFDQFTLEEYELWWDALPKVQQKVYLQATNDTDLLNTQAKQTLSQLVRSVEKTQFDYQQQHITNLTNELEMDDAQRSTM